MSEPLAPMPIEEVLQKHYKSLLSISGVVGIAEGFRDSQTCVVVLVTKRTAEFEMKIPNTLDGYRVVIKETGELRALPDIP
jgi:hypothetical protein